jgi:uncharacterized delta-60 repeat protein
MGNASTPGSLDPSFSRDGIKLIDMGWSDYAQALHPRDDGKVLVVGSSIRGAIGSRRLGLSLVRSDGRLARRFGGDGTVVLNPGTGRLHAAAWSFDHEGTAIVLGHRDDGYYLMRINANGSLDRSFGSDGVVEGRLGQGFQLNWDVAVTSHGRILVLGTNELTTVLVQHRRNGQRYRAFAEGGARRIARFDGRVLLLRPDGRILIVGTRSRRRLAIEALLPNGATDATFGSNGRATIGPISSRGDLFVNTGGASLLRNGDIVIAAELDIDFRSNMVIARVDSSGAPAQFGGRDGWRTVDVGNIDVPHDVVETSRGNLVIVGYVAQDRFGDDLSSDLMMVGLHASGRSWRAFGAGGVVRTDFGRPSDEVRVFDALLIGGKVVVAGTSRGNYLIARFTIE